MTRLEQVKICRECKHKKSNLKQGIICGLTNDLPTFESTCDEFEPIDQSYKEIASEIQKQNSPYDQNNTFSNPHNIEQIEPERMVKSGANWFYWIAGLSLINSIMIYSGSEYNFILGLGFTQLIDGILLDIFGSFSVLGFILNLFIIGVFATFGYYANRLSKRAFIAGMIIYGLDSLIFLLILDWFAIGFHVFALVMIFKGFSRLKELQPILEETEI